MSEDKKMDMWQKSVIGLIALMIGGGGATQLLPNYDTDFEYLKESLKRVELKVDSNPQREDIVRLEMQLEKLEDRLARIEQKKNP